MVSKCCWIIAPCQCGENIAANIPVLSTLSVFQLRWHSDQILCTINFWCGLNYLYAKSLSCLIKTLQAECNHFLFGHLFHMSSESLSEAQLAASEWSNEAEIAAASVCFALKDVMCLCFSFLIRQGCLNSPKEPTDWTNRKKGSLMDWEADYIILPFKLAPPEHPSTKPEPLL